MVMGVSARAFKQGTGHGRGTRISKLANSMLRIYEMLERTTAHNPTPTLLPGPKNHKKKREKMKKEEEKKIRTGEKKPPLPFATDARCLKIHKFYKNDNITTFKKKKANNH